MSAWIRTPPPARQSAWNNLRTVDPKVAGSSPVVLARDFIFGPTPEIPVWRLLRRTGTVESRRGVINRDQQRPRSVAPWPIRGRFYFLVNLPAADLVGCLPPAAAITGARNGRKTK